MLVPFNTLPDSSKVWIYQSSRLMTNEEAEGILTSAENFVQSWTAHQAGLKAGVQVLFNAFIVFAVDESHNDASGCSIDKKVHFLKEQELKTGIRLFDRMNAAYQINEDEICIVPLSDLNSDLESGKLNFETPVFNNLVNTIYEFKKSWLIPLKESWMMNFIHKSKA